MHSEFCQSIVPLTQDVQRRRPLGEHILQSCSSTLGEVPDGGRSGSGFTLRHYRQPPLEERISSSRRIAGCRCHRYHCVTQFCLWNQCLIGREPSGQDQASLKLLLSLPTATTRRAIISSSRRIRAGCPHSINRYHCLSRSSACGISASSGHPQPGMRMRAEPSGQDPNYRSCA